MLKFSKLFGNRKQNSEPLDAEEITETQDEDTFIKPVKQRLEFSGYYLTSTKTFYSTARINEDPSIKKILQAAAPDDVLVEFRGKLLKYTETYTLISQLMLQTENIDQIGDILNYTSSLVSTEDASTYQVQ